MSITKEQLLQTNRVQAEVIGELRHELSEREVELAKIKSVMVGGSCYAALQAKLTAAEKALREAKITYQLDRSDRIKQLTAQLSEATAALVHLRAAFEMAEGGWKQKIEEVEQLKAALSGRTVLSAKEREALDHNLSPEEVREAEKNDGTNFSDWDKLAVRCAAKSYYEKIKVLAALVRRLTNGDEK